MLIELHSKGIDPWEVPMPQLSLRGEGGRQICTEIFRLHMIDKCANLDSYDPKFKGFTFYKTNRWRNVEASVDGFKEAHRRRTYKPEVFVPANLAYANFLGGVRQIEGQEAFLKGLLQKFAERLGKDNAGNLTLRQVFKLVKPTEWWLGFSHTTILLLGGHKEFRRKVASHLHWPLNDFVKCILIEPSQCNGIYYEGIRDPQAGPFFDLWIEKHRDELVSTADGAAMVARFDELRPNDFQIKADSNISIARLIEILDLRFIQNMSNDKANSCTKKIEIDLGETPLKINHLNLGRNILLEGKKQRHCVGSYLNAVMKGTYLVFQVFYKEERATLGVNLLSSLGDLSALREALATQVTRVYSLHYDQCYGVCNGSISQEFREAARSFVDNELTQWFNDQNAPNWCELMAEVQENA